MLDNPVIANNLLDSPDVIVLTDIPSPYQVELFNAISDEVPNFHVIYHRRMDPRRSWNLGGVRHSHEYLDLTPLAELKLKIERAMIGVFSGYGPPKIRLLMEARRKAKRPWCFWGETPGVRKPRVLGIIKRRFSLLPLHRCRAPIWGIGSRAVQKYKLEFGENRPYFNVPYFSNLERFSQERNLQDKKSFNFLYSGSLIHRKGVDVLADAYKRLLLVNRNLTLTFVGSGNLLPLLKAQFENEPTVKFEGFRSWEELPKAYAAADCLVVPSRYDGWALVVPEGLAAGLPVISTNQTGAAIDLIANRRNGWITEAGSVESLYQAMLEVSSKSTRELQDLSHDARLTSQKCDVSSGVNVFTNAIAETCAEYNETSRFSPNTLGELRSPH